MTASNSFLVYVMVWVVTLFLVLPWGVSGEEPPRIGLKLLITTVGATVAWGLICWHLAT